MTITSLLAAPATDSAAVAVESFAKHAESYPITVGFFVLLGVFLALLAGIAVTLRWFVRNYWPTYQAQQERNVQSREAEGEKLRKHVADLMQKRGDEAIKDVAAAHAVIGDKVEAMHADVSGRVDKVDGKLEKVDAKISGVHALVRALASKQGIGAMLVLIALSSLVAVVGTRLYRTASASYTCNPACTAPAWCCKTDVCCRNASSASACAPTAPHSSVAVAYDYGDDPWAEQDVRRTSL